jgi:hypothetical protein
MMITHPCHPAFFVDRPTPEERADYFGGMARQDILVSLIQGSEESFAQGCEVCRAVFAPAGKAHRVTVEQFAFLEPAMSGPHRGKRRSFRLSRRNRLRGLVRACCLWARRWSRMGACCGCVRLLCCHRALFRLPARSAIESIGICAPWL